MHFPPLALGKIIRPEKSIAFLDFELPDKLTASGTLKLIAAFYHFSHTILCSGCFKITWHCNYVQLLHT